MTRSLAILLLALLASAPLIAADSPEITVLRNGSEIADGSTDTVYGAVAATSLRIVYVIANTGAAPLTIGTPIVPVAVGGNTTVSVVSQPDASIPANSTSSLVLDVTAAATGAWGFTVSFASNDGSENPTNWAAGGTAVVTAVPEIRITRGATVLADAGSDPFPGTINGIPESRSYTVTNQGSANLTLQVPSIVGASQCAASASFASLAPLAPGASTTLSVEVTPSAAVVWSFDLHVGSDAVNVPLFNWTISDTDGADPLGPEISLSRNSVIIANGSTETVAGGTAGSGVPLTYYVTNVGTSTLLMSGSPSFSGMVNCTAALSSALFPPVFIIPGTANRISFGIQVIPSSNAAWSVTVSVPNDDSNEGPTTWTIRGTASAGGSGGSSDDADGGGGCGAGAIGGLILALSLLGLRLRRRR